MSVIPYKPKQQYTHDDPTHPYKTTEEYKIWKRSQYKKNADHYLALAKKWRDKNPDWYKLNQREYRKKHPHATNGNATRTKKMWDAQNHAEQIPLADFCECCPTDDLRPAVIRHHPDYNIPWLFVSVCQACHSNIHADLKKEKKLLEACTIE